MEMVECLDYVTPSEKNAVETIRIISILHRQFAFNSTDRSHFIALNF